MATAGGGNAGNDNVDEAGEADDSSGAEPTALVCAICLEQYRRPKLLPCFHTFCQGCLQRVAGDSPSFPCPICRKVVLLPSAGGVRALQANFYIEEDVNAATPSPHQHLCHVCTDDTEAAHLCMQCQQKFCDTCRKYHDAFKLFRGHSVVSLDPAMGGGGTGQGGALSEDAQEKMCPKHPTQPCLLYCKQCRTEICVQCKLTRHDGHPTDDSADVRVAAQTKLHAVLAELTGRIQQLDQLAQAVSHRQATLQQQQRLTEQDLKGRADALRRWVGQSLDDAVTSVETTSKELDRGLEDQAQRLKNQRLSLQAMQDHLVRVVKDGGATDVAALEAQLSGSTLDDVDVEERVKTELTRDFTAFCVKHDPTTVNQAQLRSFIGVLEPTQPPPSPGDVRSAPGPMQQAAGPASSAGPACVARPPGPTSSAQRFIVTARKKPPTEFIISKNPSSAVETMCPISENRVWIRYKPSICCSSHLRLLDAERNSTTDVSVGNGGLCYIAHDTVITWKRYTNETYLIRPDGNVTFHDMGFPLLYVNSSAANKSHYIKNNISKDNNLYEVKFVLARSNKPDGEATESSASSTRAANGSTTPDQLTISETGVVSQSLTNVGILYSVSADGRYFAFFQYQHFRILEIYSQAFGGSMNHMSPYTTDKTPRDACFCLIEGHERMLVTVEGDSRVHVVDHTDGCQFLRYLDTSPLALDRPGCLASDFYRTLWIGCGGGKVVRVDL